MIRQLSWFRSAALAALLAFGGAAASAQEVEEGGYEPFDPNAPALVFTEPTKPVRSREAPGHHLWYVMVLGSRHGA